VAHPSDDPVILDYREQIAGLDRQILAALNARLERVRSLRAHKRARGLDFVDPDQEARLLAELVRANPGPLSEAGVRAIFGGILEQLKREAAGS
jgi:chorismate mutase/prephenate dehydratase